MSLLVWLPLNGTLENKGLNQCEFLNNDAIIFNEGKISALSYDVTNGPIYCKNFLLSTEAFSVFCWVKFKEFPDGNAYIISLNGSSTSSDMQFILGVNKKSANNYALLTMNVSSVLKGQLFLNKWHHVGFTFLNKKVTLYMDGVSIGTGTIVSSAKTHLVIGARSNNSAGTSFAGKISALINDVRIYDHCLSILEVKEIALGLILHYKFDEANYNMGIGSLLLNFYSLASKSNNYWGKSNSLNLSINSNGFAQTEATASFYGVRLWANSLNLTIGLNYTISCMAYTNQPSNAARLSFYPMMYNSFNARDTTSTLPISVLGGTFTEVNSKLIANLTTIPTLYWATFTWNLTMQNIINNGGTVLLTLLTHGTFNTDDIFYIYAPKLELGNSPTGWRESFEESGNIIKQITDSSGYNHNGLIVGTVETFTTNNVRYNNCLYINSNNFSNNTTDEYYISADCGLTAPSSMSISWWSYPEKSYNSSTTIVNGMWCTTANNIASDYLVSAFNHRDSVFDVNASDGTHITLPTSSTVVTGSEWHHYVVTYDGQTAKFYKDTILQSSVAFTGPKTLGNFTKILIGHSRAGGIHRKVKGKYSDFRVYATALDDNDIKNLYNISMKMDSFDNIHTFNIKELGGKELITDEPLYTPYSSTTTPWTSYDSNGDIYMTGTCSLGTRKTIEINPTGSTYYYDFDISMNSGNRIYLLISRYDENFTSRSNEASVNIRYINASADIDHLHLYGTINLSTDGENPCKYIRFRAFCGYTGSTAENPYLIIHSMSLREVKALQSLKILKNGDFIVDTIDEQNGNIQFFKSGMTKAAEFIER